MMKLFAVAAFALAVATSAQAMPLAPLSQPDGVIRKPVWAVARAGSWSTVSASPEPECARSAERPAGVHDIPEAFAFS